MVMRCVKHPFNYGSIGLVSLSGSKPKIKRETRVAKLPKILREKNWKGRLKATELARCDSLKYAADASLVRSLCASQSRREKLPRKEPASPVSLRETDGVTCPFIPVVGKTGIPLMPCHPARARELLRKGRAVRRFKEGIFYIQLLDRENGDTQTVSCGIDSGIKREGFTVKNEKRTFINVLSNAVDTIKEKMDIRRSMRKTRRIRKTPCRKCKYNRKMGQVPPSVQARWQAKFRIINILKKLYPISIYVIEDIKARSKKNDRNWSTSFSPLESGKKSFYNKIKQIGDLVLLRGKDTTKLRELLVLKKTECKLDDTFEAHNIDSWVLANSVFKNNKQPENLNLYRFVSHNFRRRRLHYLQPKKNVGRGVHGGTMSMGIKRGTVVRTKKYGLVYIGGCSKKGLSVHDITSGNRLAQNINIDGIDEMYRSKWRVWYLTR